MIGVFDSGYGGLAVLRKLVDSLPEYSFTYLGDNAREPYGSCTEEEIFQFTQAGAEYLFDHGCEIVLLLCNTVSAAALRRIQQEFLPNQHPKNRVLGILVPVIETITGIPWGSPVRVRLFGAKDRVVAVLGTEATVRSQIYTKAIRRHDPNIEVVEYACPELTSSLVAEDTEAEIRVALKKCLRGLAEKMDHAGITTPPDSVLLGCTHFALIKDLVRQELPQNVELISQGRIVAENFKYYLQRHSEINSKLDQQGRRRFLTTGDPKVVNRLGSLYFGEEIKFEPVKID
ncbi:MAG: aspartate/glutamate racemase family protein [Candidatus Uhrbacteria bacterium]|nr:aspartate/glutamate racemase family protein [Patescibacteria group bacterium]MBU1907129.1 aspartate/glutamate racemase family protein [Patescibacteria group bacterium]